MLLQQLSWQQKLLQLQLPWRLLQPLSHQGGDDTTGRGAAGLVLLAGLAGAGDGGSRSSLEIHPQPAPRVSGVGVQLVDLRISRHVFSSYRDKDWA